MYNWIYNFRRGIVESHQAKKIDDISGNWHKGTTHFSKVFLQILDSSTKNFNKIII
jgi:hypothetical protein